MKEECRGGEDVWVPEGRMEGIREDGREWESTGSITGEYRGREWESTGADNMKVHGKIIGEYKGR